MDKGLSADALVFARVWKQKKPLPLFGDPEPGYVGIWRGQTAPPPRIGPAAPKRWAAEADIERPYGPRPYELKFLQAIESAVITDRLRLSNDPYTYQRLRDLKAHIHERAIESGAAFQGKEQPLPHELRRAEARGEVKRRGNYPPPKYARGIRYAELEGIELYRRHDQLRWFIDAKFNEDDVEDKKGLDSAIADAAGFEFQEVDNAVAERRERYGRPLRERRKAGRKPIGPIAMLTKERVANHRRAKRLQALVTPGRPQTGVGQPPPLRRPAPVDLLRKEKK